MMSINTADTGDKVDMNRQNWEEIDRYLLIERWIDWTRKWLMNGWMKNIYIYIYTYIYRVKWILSGILMALNTADVGELVDMNRWNWEERDR